MSLLALNVKSFTTSVASILRKNAKIYANHACPECTRYRLTKNTDGTPLRGNAATVASRNVADESMLDVTSASVSDTTENADTVSTATVTAQTCDAELAKELRRFSEEMQQMRDAFLLLRREVEEMRASVTACGSRLDNLEAKVEALERRGGDEGVAEVAARVEVLERREEDGGVVAAVAGLEATIAKLKMEVQDREQDLLQNDADISNIPETKGENVMHLVIACAAKVGMKLEEQDIVSCMRVGVVRNNTNAEDTASSPAPPRPRPIAVRLARRALRDSLLQAARVRRAPDTQGIGLAGQSHRFYINERLSRENRRIFYMVRELAKQQKFRYVWTRNGRIYVRKEKGENSHHMRNETDIGKVFRIDCVHTAQ